MEQLLFPQDARLVDGLREAGLMTVSLCRERRIPIAGFAAQLGLES